MEVKTSGPLPKKSGPDFVLRIGAIVFALIVAAKLLNFFKKILIGKLFGISWVADNFFAASYLPYETGVFFEGVIYLAVLPLFSRIMAEKGRQEAEAFVAQILPPVLILTGLIVLAVFFGAPWWVRAMVPGFSPDRQHLTADLFRVISFVIVFIALCSFFQALNSYFGKYVIAASRGVIETAVMIAVTFFTCRVWGIHGAAWGAVLGAFSAFIFQFVFFRRGNRIFLPKLVFRVRPFLEFLKILFPMGAIWIFQMIPLVILNRFGSGMWQGTISALVIAQGIMVVPTALVSQTVLISLFPSLARQVGEAEHGNARETFFQILRAAFFILVPVGFLLSALARPIAVLFFSGGGMAAEGTLRIANSLACLGWGAFAFYADLFMVQSLIAMRKIFTAVCLCITRAVLMYGFSYFLSSAWDYRGLALSFSLALGVNLFVFFPLFFRRTPLTGNWKSLYGHFGKLLAAASPALIGAWFLNRWPVKAWMAFPPAEVFLWTFLALLVFGAFYFPLLFCFKVKEFYSVVAVFKKIGGRRDGWIADTSDV